MHGATIELRGCAAHKLVLSQNYTKLDVGVFFGTLSVINDNLRIFLFYPHFKNDG